MLVLVVPGTDSESSLVPGHFPEDLYEMPDDAFTGVINLNSRFRAGDIDAAVELEGKPEPPASRPSRGKPVHIKNGQVDPCW